MDNPIRYHEDKNPNGEFLPGVPLDDMTAEQFEALPPWLQASVTACPFYTVPVKLRPVMPETEPADTTTTDVSTAANKRRANTVRPANG